MKIFSRLSLYGAIVLFIISGFFHIDVFSQVNCNYEPPRQAENWIFGNSAQISFENGQANASTTINDIVFPNGVSAISNKDGNLKLFSDGILVKNGGFYTLTNGDSLKGNNYASQSSIIIPQPGSSIRYYLFTVDMYIPVPDGFTDGVNYSIIEMPYDGDASVILKNELLFKENAQKITATQHANGQDYWVVAHGFGDDKGKNFYSYLLSNSLETTPVISKRGNPQNGNIENAETLYNGAGSMKISPDGTKLALVIPHDGIVEVYKFDNEKGIVSNLKAASDYQQFVSAIGIEFSPDNSKLYFTISPLDVGTNYIYQVDLEKEDPFGDVFEVHKFDIGGSADSLLGALQLAPDGKIYVAKYMQSDGKNNLGVIYNPNRKGAACNYNKLNDTINNGLYLKGGKSLMGLPNFVSSFLDIPHFYYTNQCHKDTTKFTIRNTANIDDTEWDFSNQGDLVGNDILAPGFVFSDPGDYTVSLTEIYGDENYSFEKDVRIHPLPNVKLADGASLVYILENSSIQLDAGDWDFYEWQDGSTERYFDVISEGIYSVTVTDSNCCINTATVEIRYATVNFPTAFKPNSTNIENSTFKIVGDLLNFKSYRLIIYNRWGQKLFETEDPTEGWDGTYNGEEAPYGTYVFSAYFESFESSEVSSLNSTKNGSFTLIR